MPSMDQVKQATVVQQIQHPVFGKLAVCNCVFSNGKKGLAYRKEVMIESLAVAQKLLDLSKLRDTAARDHFLTVYGYSVENYSVISAHQAMCGNNTVVSVFFEPFETSLAQVLAQHKDTGLGTVGEQQLVEIIHGVCKVSDHKTGIAGPQGRQGKTWQYFPTECVPCRGQIQDLPPRGAQAGNRRQSDQVPEQREALCCSRSAQTLQQGQPVTKGKG
jgi:hypothetical protein